MDSHHQLSQWLGSGASAAAIIGAFLGWAPAIAALIAGIWYCVQIYESRTVQRYMAGRRLRKLARLKARVLMLEAQSKDPLPGFDDDDR